MLDVAMEAAGIDVLLVTSKHNAQYLLGGYRYSFFERMDAIGQSRYLPILIYPRGAPEKAAYFANRMESFEQELAPLWTRGSHALLGNARRHGGGPNLPEANRVRLSSDRCRGVIPASRCLSGAAGRSSPCADPRGAWPAGTFESGKNSEGTRLLADCLRVRRRLHAGRFPGLRFRHNQARARSRLETGGTSAGLTFAPATNRPAGSQPLH